MVISLYLLATVVFHPLLLPLQQLIVLAQMDASFGSCLMDMLMQLGNLE